MVRGGLLEEVKNVVKIGPEKSEALIRHLLRCVGEGNNVWILVYDFLEVRENSDKVRKFYRNLKKLDGGYRRTDSEIIFNDLEEALLARELAERCGAKTSMYGGVEISDDF